MKPSHPLAHRISRRFALPSELLTAEPEITLKGNAEAVIQNHCGLLEYAEEQIRIASGIGILRLQGAELRIYRMDRESLVVYGRIDSVTYEEVGR